MVVAVRADVVESLRAKLAVVLPHLDERQQRLVMAGEARSLGHGGIAAVADHYDAQDPADVAPQLVEAGERVAGVFDAVPADAWSRTARRSDGAVFTVTTLAQYFIHDIEHHVHDVGA